MTAERVQQLLASIEADYKKIGQDEVNLIVRKHRLEGAAEALRLVLQELSVEPPVSEPVVD
jgi:hypothetical protein